MSQPFLIKFKADEGQIVLIIKPEHMRSLASLVQAILTQNGIPCDMKEVLNAVPKQDA